MDDSGAPTNSLVDIPGVLVGTKTRIEGDGPLMAGSHWVRDGGY